MQLEIRYPVKYDIIPTSAERILALLLQVKLAGIVMVTGRTHGTTIQLPM
jgi:hypothetical protein